MEEFVAKQADKALKNKVLSSGSEVFLTAKLATDGVDFFNGSVRQCHVRSNTAFEMRIQRNNGPRINRSSSKASTGNFSQGLTSLKRFCCCSQRSSLSERIAFVQQLLVGFPYFLKSFFSAVYRFKNEDFLCSNFAVGRRIRFLQPDKPLTAFL